MSEDIDYLGKFFVQHFRNTAEECISGLCQNKFDSPGHRDYQKLLDSFSEEQKATIEKIVIYCVEGALNDTLYHLDDELHGKQGKLKILVDGKPVSNNDPHKKLNAHLWGPQGWLARYRNSSRREGQ